MRKYEWVPLEVLVRAVGLDEPEVSFRISRLMEKGMVRYNAVPYDGYSLVFFGYDALALRTLTKKGTIQALGCMIGVGKESVVYEGLGLGCVALKLHHVGQRSFQSVRLNREYKPGQTHSPWIFTSRQSAEREFLALTTLHPDVKVPLPIDQNRHIVVMEYIPGVNLNNARVEEPREFLDEILGEVRKAYHLGIIHADFSEFNIMVNERGCTLIDWPQWMEVGHPNAETILRRDINNILTYFSRKYQLSYDIEDTYRCVTS